MAIIWAFSINLTKHSFGRTFSVSYQGLKLSFMSEIDTKYRLLIVFLTLHHPDCSIKKGVINAHKNCLSWHTFRIIFICHNILSYHLIFFVKIRFITRRAIFGKYSFGDKLCEQMIRHNNFMRHASNIDKFENVFFLF